MKKRLWLHQVATGIQDGKEITNEQWMSFESKVYAFKISDGHIGYHDYSKPTVWDYDPKSKTISISYPKYKTDNLFHKFSSIDSFLGVQTEELDKQGGNIIRKRGIYDGNTVEIIEIQFLEHPVLKTTDITFYINLENQLIIAQKFKVKDKNSDIIMEGEIKIDYPEKGPTNIYDLGIPSSAKIMDSKKPETEVEKAFNKAIEIIDSRKSWSEPRDLVVAYWEARASKNYNEMSVLWPGSATWNRRIIESEEPVEYAIGEVQSTEFNGYIIVPYASKDYYEKHAKYNLKMRLTNRKSTKGRYYIYSGN
jgi:hypothetical protein